MTLAGAGVDAITTGMLFPVTGPDSGYSGGTGAISGLSDRTQENVTEELKGHVQNSPGWNLSTTNVWEFLRAGISLPLAIIEGLVHSIFPFSLPNFLDIDHAFDMVEDGMGNLFTFLGSINPFDPSFNIADAAIAFINLVLSPVNLLAELVGGFIPGFQIPGLDASKIISGLFDPSMVNGLVNIFTTVVGNPLAGALDFIASLLGFGSSVLPAYTPENSAVANLQGQLNAIQAQISSTGEGDVDGFNYPPLSNVDWVSIYNSATVTAGGYVVSGNPGVTGAYYTCQRFEKNRPSTTLWQVQMTIVGNPDGTMKLGISRFGGGADATLNTRFPAVEFDVNPFGAFVRLGSLAGSPNAFNNGSIGWIEYNHVDLTSTIKNGDVLALEVDEVAKVYNVYLNPGPGSTPIMTITDSSNTIPRGVGHRDAWFQLNVLNDPFGVGNGWDNFFLFDRI